MCGPDARALPGPDRFSDVRWVHEVTSTNDVVADLARSGTPDGVVVAAQHQTAGRGRRGRAWESPPGAESLLVSVLVRPVPALLTLAAGLAVVDAVGQVADVEVALKWPNDVIFDGSKLAGILAELHGDAAVVGLGLNLHWPGALAEGACSLSGLTGRSFERRDVLTAWLRALSARLAQPSALMLHHYRSACSTLGRPVRVEMATTVIEGLAVDVDTVGRLVVDGKAIEAGDVIHLR